MRMRFLARKTFITVPARLAALALVFVAALPATASARVIISGGEAKLALDHGLVRQLEREGVDVAGIKPGTAGAGKGQSTAKIAGTHRILAKHGALQSSPAGFGTRIRIPDLRLTSGTAGALNRRLGLRGVFRPGRRLGSLVIVAIQDSVEIAFGKIAMGGPGTAFSKLESLDVQMGIWGASERWSAGVETYFLFEVGPTAVAPDASAGIIESSNNDGVTLEIHAPPPRNMLVRGPRIDLAARELSATVSPLSAENPVTATIATLDYSAARFQVRPRVGAFELMGIRAVANQFIADQLNERFATPGLFQAGETLAQMTVTLHAS
jgi:hypothetical protein